MGTGQPRVGEIPLPPLMSCVTSGSGFILAEPQFSSCEKAAQIISPRIVLGDYPMFQSIVVVGAKRWDFTVLNLASLLNGAVFALTAPDFEHLSL